MLNMSFEISNKKKTKNQKFGNGGGINEISSASLITNKSHTNRAGLRVYKIVILGDGGVGKSGENFMRFHFNFHLTWASNPFHKFPLLQQIVVSWRKNYTHAHWHRVDDAKYFSFPFSLTHARLITHRIPLLSIKYLFFVLRMVHNIWILTLKFDEYFSLPFT